MLAGIPFCPEVAIALARTHTGHQEQTEPACPASSRLGSSQVGTGVGAVLAYTPGTVYLGGPYNGDPFSLVSVTSAVVGPFDLGSIVIRFGLKMLLDQSNIRSVQAVGATDALLLFGVGMIAVARIEMWIRCRRLMAAGAGIA